MAVVPSVVSNVVLAVVPELLPLVQSVAGLLVELLAASDDGLVAPDDG